MTVACDGGWRRFELGGDDCRFSALLPAEPQETRFRVRTVTAETEFRWYALSLPRDLVRSQNFINTVGMGCAVLPADDAVGALAAPEAWLPREFRGRVLSRRALTGPVPGSEVEIYVAPLRYIARFHVTGRTMFEAIAGKSGNRAFGGTERRILDSFSAGVEGTPSNRE